MTATIPSTDFIDYYRVLGLQSDWDTERIRKALREAFAGTKARVNAATGKKREEIDARLKLITQATKILTDTDARSRYDRDLAEWNRTATSEQKAAAATVPTLEELWKSIGEGQYLAAIQGGKLLIESSPENHRAWEVYGYANYLWQDFQTAIHAASRAISCNPQKAEYYADASRYLAAAGQWDEAHTQLNRAIQLEPNNSGYRLALADIYMKHEMWTDAQSILESVLTTEPSNNAVRPLLAIVYGSHAQAMLPEIEHLFNAGRVGEARKHLKSVKKLFEEAQKLAGNDPDLKDLLNSESIVVRRALGANIFQRGAGALIDNFLVYPGSAIVSVGGDTFATFGLLVVLATLIYAWIWLPYRNNGQDLAKRLVGLQIVNRNEASTPEIAKLIIRAVMKPFGYALGVLAIFCRLIISIAGIFKLNFADASELFEFGRSGFVGIHEMLTGTVVICSTKDDFVNLGEYHWY